MPSRSYRLDDVDRVERRLKEEGIETNRFDYDWGLAGRIGTTVMIFFSGFDPVTICTDIERDIARLKEKANARA